MSHNANDTKIFNNYKAGLWNVGSYQVAGRPWLSGSKPGPNGHTSGSVKVFEFPSVTKRIVVTNKLNPAHSAPCKIRISFVPSAAGNVYENMHYVELSGATETVFDMNVKCKELYISGSSASCVYSIAAELTGIPAKEMYVLTGSGLTD